MTQEDFLLSFQDVLQTEETIHPDTKFHNLEDWDSLAAMALIAFFDRNFAISLTFEHFASCVTVADIMALSKGAITV